MNDLSLQYERYKSTIDQNIQTVINTTQFIGGDFVRRLEQELAAYLHCTEVITCGNGTDALMMALMALDLPAGSEVIVPAFTLGAPAEAARLLGLRPVFADVDSDTFLINPDSVASLLTVNTSCIIPVHLFGQCADMAALQALVAGRNIRIIEDTAQALGSKWLPTGQMAGTIGDIGTTSFFPSKNLGCYGDGGALMTNDPMLGERIRMIRNHGTRKKYFHEIIGVNSRLDNLQAAILCAKLPHLDDDIRKRQEAAALYGAELTDLEFLKIPVRSHNSTHTYHQYTVRIPGHRDRMAKFMQENGISSAVYYPSSLHRQPAFLDANHEEFQCPVSDQLCIEVLSLPIYPDITAEQIQYICQTIKKGF